MPSSLATLTVCLALLSYAKHCTASSALGAKREAPSAREIEELLQPIVDAESSKYNCTIAVSVKIPAVNGGVPVSAVAGYVDIPGRVSAKADDIFVWGSITKMSTGAAILRLAEEGKLDLDSPIYPVVDALLRKMRRLNPRQNFTSMVELFGSESRKVTARHAATMTSGIPDFDTAQPWPLPPTDSFRSAVYNNSKHEYGPAELISLPWVAVGKLDFTPGSRQAYSSTNFVLLGLVLASLSGAESWDAYDQASFLPSELRKVLNRTRYATHGAPYNFTRVKGYDRTSYNGHDPSALPGLDVWKVRGVFGGWSASDYVAPVHDAAEFVYDLYGPKHEIISKESVETMIPTNGFYGFATFNLTRYTGQTGKYGTAIGHLGATYGYDSVLAYMPSTDFSLAIASNMENDIQTHPADTFCLAYNEIKNKITGEKTHCLFQPGDYYHGGCKCSETEGSAKSS